MLFRAILDARGAPRVGRSPKTESPTMQRTLRACPCGLNRHDRADLHLADRDALRSYLQRRVRAPFLRCRSVVVLQQTAQPLTADDAVVASRLNTSGENQSIAQALMVPLLVIMHDEFANRSSQ